MSTFEKFPKRNRLVLIYSGVHSGESLPARPRGAKKDAVPRRVPQCIMIHYFLFFPSVSSSALFFFSSGFIFSTGAIENSSLLFIEFGMIHSGYLPAAIICMIC